MRQCKKHTSVNAAERPLDPSTKHSLEETKWHYNTFKSSVLLKGCAAMRFVAQHCHRQIIVIEKDMCLNWSHQCSGKLFTFMNKDIM